MYPPMFRIHLVYNSDIRVLAATT